ncbi:cation diffusion facilitator family transporter [Rossellomorea yichunensis]|uniref:cation diffusion facilitator family transporter n=1 Tax=Rossellomorea yichunensis TaxID=3077331 RepID=UPI0028DF42BA|nr:cation diffusion facilitator family transporter [Rossellomorea sp. YC4-1]MDT9023400.1 cation diffusion facilitator family transporter [Rossellomorea sp. YC4-1]
MGHDHSHGHNQNKKALLISFLFIFTFMIVEVIGGIVTNSLALLSDAGHMLSDAAALGLSLAAFYIGEKASDKGKTYGYKRFEILAAFINGITLLLVSLYIFWEAYHRFIDTPVVSPGMMVIAIIGLIVNIIVAWILMRGDTEHNLNVRSAFLHVLGDMLGSVGAIAAGLLIYFFNWNLADPIASVMVAILIVISGWRVTKDSIHILMEGTPKGIDMEDVKNSLAAAPGVIEVHDLHVWCITSGFTALSCHVVVGNEVNRDTILLRLSAYLEEEFGIHHSTIQVEGKNVTEGHHHICT